MKARTRTILRWLFVLVSIGVLVGVGLLDQNMDELGKTLLSIERLWLVAAILCMVFYWLSEAGILYLGCRYMPGHMRYTSSIRLSLVGQYYSALTPFSSGGQPFQIAYMRRWGIPVGGSTGMFVLKFVFWQVGVSLASVLALVHFFDLISSRSGLMAAVILGLVINAGAGLLALLALSRVNVEKPMMAILRLLHRMKIVKNLERRQAKMRASMDEFGEATALVRTHPVTALGMAALTVTQIVALFLVMYCIYRGFGERALGVSDVLRLQSILNTTVSFVPLPGAAGATEGVFYVLYSTLFPTNLIYAAMLIWRFLTYYLHLILGTLITLVDSILARKRAR